MLKNLLTLLAIGSAMSVSADVLWEGSQPTGNWASDGFVLIEAEKFAAAAEGNSLIVNFTHDNAAAEYTQIMLQTGDWKDIACDKTATNRDQYNCFPDGVNETVFTFAADDVTTIKEVGLVVKGCGAVITKISLESEAPAPATSYTWEGNVDLGKWDNNIEISAANVGFMAEGMKITFYFSVKDGAEYGNFLLKDGSWANMDDLNATRTNVDSYDCFQPGTTESTVTCNAADAANIANGGLKVSGEGLIVTKIVFNSQGGDTPDNPDNPSADSYTWEGNVATEGWKNYVEIPAAKIGFVKEGTEIIIDFTVAEGKDYGQLELNDGAWNKVEATNATGTNKDSQNCFQAGTTSSTYTVAAADATAIATSGLVIKGENVVITKVTVGKDNGGNQDGIADVNVDNSNAPVEYYNLQGVRVINPAAGTIVIRRQGTEVSKIRF